MHNALGYECHVCADIRRTDEKIGRKCHKEIFLVSVNSWGQFPYYEYPFQSFILDKSMLFDFSHFLSQIERHCVYGNIKTSQIK